MLPGQPRTLDPDMSLRFMSDEAPVGHVGTQLSGLVLIFRQLFRCVAWLRDVVEKVHLVPDLSPNAGVKCLACLRLISAASLLANLREGRRYSLPTHSKRDGCPPAGH